MDFKIGLGGGGGEASGGGAASSNNASSCSDDDNAPSAKVARTTSTTTTTTQQQQAQSFHQLMMMRKQQQCCSPTDSTAASSGEEALLPSASRPHHGQQLMLPPPPPHFLSPLEQQQQQQQVAGVYQYKQTGCGGMQLAMSLQEAALGPRYPFSAVQWAELEHQALVFKYMMARVPPPPELIAPIRKSVAALQGLFHAGSTTTAIGGTHVHHLDLEPGRCRRTDGKKWRCARPIVPDQKYCERHINRGKHKRSNKNSSNNNANSNDNNANRNTNSSNQRSSSQPVAVGGGVEPLQSRFPAATTTNSSGSGPTTFGIGQQPATSNMASFPQQMRSVNGSHQHSVHQQQFYMATPNLSSKDRFLSGPVCSEQLLFSEVSGSTKPAVATPYVRPQTTGTQSQYYYESRTPTSTTTTEEGDAFYVSSGSSSILQQRDRQQQHSYLASQQQQEDVKRLKPLFKEWPSTSSSNSDEKDNKVNLSMNNGGRDEQDYTSALGGPLAEALQKAGGEQQRQRSSDDKPTGFWLSDVR